LRQGAWPDIALLLVGLVGGLAFVGWVVGSVVAGLGFVWKGLRLMLPRTWRQVQARLERADIQHDMDAGWYVAVHYQFALDRPGAVTEPCSGSMIDNSSYSTKSEAQERAFAYRAQGTLDVWYAEELPSLQYQSRPYWAWEATKGLGMIAIGLFVGTSPVLILKPTWLGLR
jgi:hypothetical protein